MRFPSFSKPSFFEICDRRGEWVLYSSTVAERYPRSAIVGYELVPFEGAVLGDFVRRISDIRVPAVPPLSGMAGLDGAVTRLAVFGDLSAQVRYQWWSDPPAGWEPLAQCVGEMIDRIEGL